MFGIESESMGIKRILRFYFNAERINLHIDGLILKYACDPQINTDAGVGAIGGLIDNKCALENLWAYLDGVVNELCGEEVKALRFYSDMRTGLKRLDCGKVKLIRRAVVKFTRRARRLQFFDKELKLVNAYYCLL